MTMNLSASVLAGLPNLAKEPGNNYHPLLNHLAPERLLCRATDSPRADHFLLKGALLFALRYDAPQRPTGDADPLGFGANDANSLTETFRAFTAVDLDDGITFDPQSSERHRDRGVIKRSDWRGGRARPSTSTEFSGPASGVAGDRGDDLAGVQRTKRSAENGTSASSSSGRRSRAA